MANTTIEELLNLAYEVRDADQAGENTALRVGGLLEEIIQYLSTVVDLDTLQAILEEYATVTGGGLIYWRQSRIICLASMGYDLDNTDGGNWNYTNSNGDIVFSPIGGGRLNVVGTTGDFSVFQNVVYVNNHTGHAYLWKLVGNTYKMVEIRDSSPTTIITYLNTPPFSQVAVGESYFYASGSTRKIAIKLSSDEVYSFDPNPKKIYVFLDTKQTMVWDSGNRQWISVGGNLIQLINDLKTGGEDKALSAEMGKLLRTKIDEVEANIQRLYNNLGNIAFWDATAKASAAPVPLDWGDPKHTVTLDLDLTNAVVKHNGVAVSDGDTIQVEEYGTLTLTVEGASGYALNSVFSQVGAVSQDLTTVTLVVGQSDVTLDITAVAVATYSIAIGTLTKCSVVGSAPASIDGGGSVDIEFATDIGYQLDASCFTVTNASKAWDANTSKLTISNPVGNVSISAEAVVPKLKFLKGYRLTGYDTISNSEWLKDGVDISARASVSQMMKVPMQEVSELPAVNAYWGISMASSESLPYAIAFYSITNETFDPIGHYVFKPGSTYKQDLVGNSMSYADEKSKDDILNALVTGTLGIRVTICTNEAGTALLRGVSYGVKIGSFVFQPDSPAGNYEFTTDATYFLDQVFEF